MNVRSIIYKSIYPCYNKAEYLMGMSQQFLRIYYVPVGRDSNYNSLKSLDELVNLRVLLDILIIYATRHINWFCSKWEMDLQKMNIKPDNWQHILCQYIELTYPTHGFHGNFCAWDLSYTVVLIRLTVLKYKLEYVSVLTSALFPSWWLSLDQLSVFHFLVPSLLQI
jgi:hypothetical protein